MEDFKKVIYLDNNATTKIAPEVVESMLPFFGDCYGNPSSIHRFGGLIRRYVDDAREKVAALINASPEEIYFTASGSEGDNMAIQGFCQEHGARSRIITSTVEHPAVRNTARAMKKRNAQLSEVGVDNEGMLLVDNLKALPIDNDTLVSLMWANNETGVVFPIEEITAYAKSKGGFVHTDAVQAAGKVPIDVKKLPLDMLVLSGHKLHAPKGIGAIYIRKGIAIDPLIKGGHQEESMRAGTENVPFIIGLGKACELGIKYMGEESTKVKAIRDKLETTLLASCKGAKLNGNKTQRLPNTTNISFEFIEGEAILLLLDELGVAASSGSACTTGSLEPSHVMLAMGIPYTFAHSSIRFSLSRYTNESEIKVVTDNLPAIVDRLRELSPFVNKV